MLRHRKSPHIPPCVTGVPRSQEKKTSKEPTVGLHQGLLVVLGGPLVVLEGGAISYERSTSVAVSHSCGLPDDVAPEETKNSVGGGWREGLPSSVSVYLDTLIRRARALFRSKVDGFVLNTQHVVQR